MSCCCCDACTGICCCPCEAMASGDDDEYSRARGGKLSLKGVGDIAKHQRPPPSRTKKHARATSMPGSSGAQPDSSSNQVSVGPSVGVGVTPDGQQSTKRYEELFPEEQRRLEKALRSGGGARSAAWQNSIRAPPDVLPGHSEPWRNKHELSAEEKVELRATTKSDKFCR